MSWSDKAQGEGRKCVATVCENVPEPLLNLPGTFSVRASFGLYNTKEEIDMLAAGIERVSRMF